MAHPRETVEWEAFRRQPGPAVALDGYVAGPTHVDGVHASFNHHDGSDRFTTRATCAQVALALRLRCDVLVRNEHARCDLAVHVNDADPDVALSVWLLEHPDLLDDPVIEHIVALEDAIDSSGGAALAGSLTDLEHLAWAIDPWVESRRCPAPTADTLVATIAEVGDRIEAWRTGRANRLDMAASYDLIERRDDVWAVIEHHPLARARLVHDGARTFIAVREGPRPGTTAVTIGKSSPFDKLDLDEVWSQLNRLESRGSSPERWGGGDWVGGSPRCLGTGLALSEIIDVIDAGLNVHPLSR